MKLEITNNEFVGANLFAREICHVRMNSHLQQCNIMKRGRSVF
jgi:hypothetical protein